MQYYNRLKWYLDSTERFAEPVDQNTSAFLQANTLALQRKSAYFRIGGKFHLKFLHDHPLQARDILDKQVLLLRSDKNRLATRSEERESVQE